MRKSRKKKRVPFKVRVDWSKWLLSDFIFQGTSVTWKSQPDQNASYEWKVKEAYDHFRIWYLALKRFLHNQGYLNQKHPRYAEAVEILEAGGVPLLIDWSADYADPKSERSQTLLKAIDVETKRLLGILRKFVTKESIPHLNPAVEKSTPLGRPKRVDANAQIRISNTTLLWGNVSMPLERGQRQIYMALSESARIFRRNRFTVRGHAVDRAVLQQRGGYKDEGSFRSALNKLRLKLKQHDLPAAILPETTNHYILEIRYP